MEFPLKIVVASIILIAIGLVIIFFIGGKSSEAFEAFRRAFSFFRK